MLDFMELAIRMLDGTSGVSLVKHDKYGSVFSPQTGSQWLVKEGIVKSDKHASVILKTMVDVSILQRITGKYYRFLAHSGPIAAFQWEERLIQYLNTKEDEGDDL